MRVVVLGGDGFCGWPTVLRLALRHDVVVVDDLSRRKIDVRSGVESLTPIAAPANRCEAAGVDFVRLDVSAGYDGLVGVLDGCDAVVHFAEQRAAPYSMKSAAHKRYTVRRNVTATHNLLAALVESGAGAHVVHLGSMGVYGYGGGHPITEGYVRLGDGREVLYPTDAGSVYHMTKVMDQTMFAFYAKNDGVRITDLHQGIVWGTNTSETLAAPELMNRFDYDGDYGTVLNRFLMQAAVGHPLTVYGTGNQTRAFIHITDMVRCIELALGNPPEAGERVRIYNQMTETHRVGELARIVALTTGAEIAHIENPRKEAAENTLDVEALGLRELGLEPTLLCDGLMAEVYDVALRYKHRADVSKIMPTVKW